MLYERYTTITSHGYDANSITEGSNTFSHRGKNAYFVMVLVTTDMLFLMHFWENNFDTVSCKDMRGKQTLKDCV